MAMVCKKCGGIIPDMGLTPMERSDCKNHRKGEVNIKYPKPIGGD